MTMISAPRTPDFPENPEDGFQIIEELPDGRQIIWTYNAELNQWNSQFVNASDAATEGWVESQGYVKGPVRTRDVLTTPDSILKVLKDADPSEDPPERPLIKTQEEVNTLIASASAKILGAGQRTALNLDFLQNTLDGGYWIHKDREQENELPGASTFFALTKAGENAENFDDAYQFVFNSAGIDSSQQLGYAAQGTTLFLADIADGGYGLYVITGVEQLGSPEGGQFICTFDVAIQRGKAGGPINLNAHVEMKVMSPSPCLVQGDEPFVDDWGYLWYNPGTKELSVSEWHSGDTPGSSDVTWSKYTPGGGGGGSAVHIDDDPPEDAALGDEWFCTKEDDLSLYVLVQLPDVWAPASPPVSLDGIQGDIENFDATLMEVQANLFATDNDVKVNTEHIEGLKTSVDYNSRELTKLRSRIGDVEYVAGNALPKAGGEMNGDLEFKCKGENEYWSYIRSIRPAAWDKENKTHGLVLDIGNTNSYKQQFKIIGRGGKTLFNMNDDGTASAQISGRLNCTQNIKIDGRDVATQDWVDQRIEDSGGGDGATARHGNEQNPLLNTGELYLRTTDNVLLVGL